MGAMRVAEAAGRPAQAPAEPVRVLAAGSLASAFAELAAAFSDRTGTAVEAGFGPAGLLRERIATGEPADLFASANMAHPRALAEARGDRVVPFARNALCALVRPGLDVDGDGLLDAMLDEAVRLGTSTPKADPSGDYAWELFDRAEAIRTGAAARLKAKALTLTGGPDAPAPPAGRSVYGAIMEAGLADVFLTYRTNAAVAAREVEGLRIVPVPGSLSVAADYGFVVLGGGRAAEALGAFIVSGEGQAILASHGFGAPRRPEQSDEGGEP